MGQPFVGEIRMFGGSFAPAGWMFCDGQLLPISENDVLFTLIGTTYGGDGQETFALPNLQSRVPMHSSNSMVLAATGGVESVTLTVNQVPAHSHPVVASAAPGYANRPTQLVPAASPNVDMYADAPATVNMAGQAVSPTGGSQPHDNVQPFLVVSYIISLYGVFPTQT
jgi:microcystin-dependent protein